MSEIYVSPLIENDKEIIPEFWLGGVEYRKDKKGDAFSVAEYNAQIQLPTLAELRNAYFDKADGNFISPEYRESVFSNHGKGEWTSTFLQDGTKAIERPENIVYRKGVWIAEGGKIIRVELPPSGWALEYDKPTGFPSRTSHKKEDAKEIFGNDTSYFYHVDSSLRAVMRCFYLYDLGMFFIGRVPGRTFGGDEDFRPDYRASNVGGRECRRQK